MKKIILLCALLCGLAAKAQQDGFGLGIIIGEPTGLSFKKFISDNKAIDGALAWSLRGEGAVHIHADVLWHNFDLINVSKGRLPLYYGIGGRITAPAHHDANFGVRIPVGLAYMFDGAPVDIFFEVVPILDLVPSSDVTFNGAIGARFYL